MVPSNCGEELSYGPRSGGGLLPGPRTGSRRPPVRGEWGQPRGRSERNDLGMLLMDGKVVPRNWPEGARQLEKASIQGLPFGAAKWGWCLLTGTGVATNVTEAIKWIRYAADHNDDLAKNSLGVRYDDATGVEVDHDKAHELFLKAAAQGSRPAMLNLGRQYDKDTVSKPTRRRRSLGPSQRLNSVRARRNTFWAFVWCSARESPPILPRRHKGSAKPPGKTTRRR
jgi:hypothetical protein